MSSLADVPDVQLNHILLCCDADTQRSLLRVSARLQRLVLIHSLRSWRDPTIPIALDRVYQLVVLARRQPRFIPIVRPLVSAQTAVRLSDALIVTGRCPRVWREFAELFELRVFDDLVPGICLDMQLQRPPMLLVDSTPDSSARRQRPIDWWHRRIKIRQILRCVGIPRTPNLIGVDVRPEIDVLLRNFARDRRPATGNAYEQYRANLTRIWGGIFEPDVLLLHRKKKQFESVRAYLLRALSGSAVLSNPAVLTSLLRLGIRFDVAEYLEHVPLRTAQQFADVAPFLSPWSYMRGSPLRGTIQRLMAANQLDHMRVLFALAPARIWLVDPCEGTFVLCNYLRLRRYDEFRTVCPYLAAEVPYREWAAHFLFIAVQLNPPRDIVDMLLDYPGTVLPLDCLDHMPAMYRNSDLLRYIQRRICQKHGVVWTRRRRVFEPDYMPPIKSRYL